MRLGTAALLALGALLVAGSPALAQVFGAQEIMSSGPLTRIIISNDLSCQVAHAVDEQFELFGGELGSCGTFLAVGGTVFGPSGGGATEVPFTAVTQAPVAGTGSAGDPLRIVTVVDAGQAGVRIQQTDSYVVGTQSYRTDVQLTNAGASPIVGILYRAGDCYLQNDDTGFGRVDNGAPACIVDPAHGQRIEQWLPSTPGSHYLEGYYGDVYAKIGEQAQFPDTCACSDDIDNGAGVSWAVSLAPGGSAQFSEQSFFSPTGGSPAAAPSFIQSVPDPLHISLDPVVVAESVAVTAGVIVLVPFPSALFNRTLEENYDEVMAGIAALRLWLAAQLAAFVAWARRLFAEWRARRVAGPQGTAQPAAVSIPPLGPQAPAASATPGVRRDVWRSPLGILGFTIVSALLYSFLDPTFGLSAESLATLAGLAAGLIAVRLAYGVPLYLLARRDGLSLTIRALPASLLVALLSVIVSRVANFEPGYLYGAIVGFLFAHGAAEKLQGRAYAAAVAASLAAALVAWLALIVLRRSSGDLGSIALEAGAVTVVVAGIEGAFFEMLPLHFMPGGPVFAWNRRVWVVLLAVGAFGFVHVLLNPISGYLSDTTRTSFLTMVVLLVGFGIASVAFWAWHHFRHPPHRTHPA